MPKSRNKQARSVKSQKSAAMLVNPISASILRHLSEKERSLTELSKILGLSKPRISYHLKRLEKERLIERTREEYHRGGIRKFYKATIPLQWPKLASLNGAEREAQLLPIKTFLWGYILGKNDSKKPDFQHLISKDINVAAQEIAETFEQMIDKEDEFDDKEADLLYLKLLHQLAKLHLEQEKIQINFTK
ncbi:MAG: ArsR/SmtB family transcription factor [Candidatus Thorarchaeota archaeon]